jgi:hypothetical protein
VRGVHGCDTVDHTCSASSESPARSGEWSCSRSALATGAGESSYRRGVDTDATGRSVTSTPRQCGQGVGSGDSGTPRVLRPRSAACARGVE